MSKNLFWLIFLGLFVSLGFTSCAEDTKIEDPYANWTERNELYLDSIVSVARKAPAGETWRIFKNYKLDVSDMFAKFYDYDSVYVKYISPIKSEDSTLPRPLYTDSVDVYYQGFLINGVRFDGNYTGKLDLDIHTPVRMDISGLTSGWTTALQNMVEGEQVELYVPYQMAYGVTGHAPEIP